jgi:hypothetical protein
MGRSARNNRKWGGNIWTANQTVPNIIGKRWKTRFQFIESGSRFIVDLELRERVTPAGT